MHLIPVSINYDRLLDMKNVAEKNLNKADITTFFRLNKMVKENFGQVLGKVYMTFGDSINLNEYVTENRFDAA